MAKRRLIWTIFPSYAVIILGVVIGTTWYMMASMKKLYLAETAKDLNARAMLAATWLSSFNLSNETAVDSLCKRIGFKSLTRFTVVLRSGKVIGDSENDPQNMDNHALRPEIQKALNGETGIASRFSRTSSVKMMYVAIPLFENDTVAAVVRAGIPVTAIDTEFKSIYPRLFFGGAIVALLAATISFYISRKISKSLGNMQKVAVQYSKGEFKAKLPDAAAFEIDELAKALNAMATELDDKIKTIIGQRNELDAILSSMMEGMLVFDKSERLVKFNMSAAKMLSLDAMASQGRFMQEIIRHPELQKMVKQVLEKGESIEDVIELVGPVSKTLQVHGTILKSKEDDISGALLVLNDITAFRRLEAVRRDFVANVSHELRTPITSIKGFVETLRDGAIHNKTDAEHFLHIIAKQADRLNSIIDDLLTLSALEAESKMTPQLELQPLKPILQEAMAICEVKAKSKNIEVELLCDEDIKAYLSPALFEQAIINLLDNAIKYSQEQGKVTLSVSAKNSEVVIAVIDRGIGMEKKHLSRIFERFYTVDKARSRELGGTGLGLSIVKHIVQVHNGSIEVDSAIGRGSTFIIHLPVV